MTSLTATSTQAVAPANPSQKGTPDWLYNELMRFINVDLMTDRLPLLELKYAGESTIEKTARHASYEKSFAVYDELSKTVLTKVADAGRREMRRRRDEVEKTGQSEDAQSLQAMDDTLSAV